MGEKEKIILNLRNWNLFHIQIDSILVILKFLFARTFNLNTSSSKYVARVADVCTDFYYPETTQLSSMQSILLLMICAFCILQGSCELPIVQWYVL